MGRLLKAVLVIAFFFSFLLYLSSGYYLNLNLTDSLNADSGVNFSLPRKDHRDVLLAESQTSGTSIYHLNRLTDNLNVLFVGIEKGKVRMISVYSINYKENMKSVAVFFHPQTVLTGESLASLYYRRGIKALEAALEKAMEIEIKYYLRIDKAILDEVSRFIDPIVVSEWEVNLSEIFTMGVTPYDEEILGALVRELTKPQVYFVHLPRLVMTFKNYVDTDFPLTLENLLVHFRIATSIDTRSIKKVIIPSRPLEQQFLTGLIYQFTR
ncbi:hypothetical protein [Calderihabitans maritimus]|uniref:Uncharacterized protein n=1 Tax=Calderihabitans maritimus TaxID=1246530 RepID=A0A1Z5HWQ5_9FIRM|nr:hypothetical protein [Calderihabitans maritimus]GAW93848.1 hypothetical protein TherJR_2879 [Calderihabitans maritimus]